MTAKSFDHIHSMYCSLTGRQIPLTMQMIYQWEAWESHGWTEPDLRLVVGHIKSLIRKDRRWPASLSFHNLIGNAERFNEDLSEARAESRVKKPTARDMILESTFRVTDNVTCNVRTAAQVIAGNKAFENWKLWRSQTGL